MATDFTPKDLAKLAKYCGKEARQHPNLPHLVLRGAGGIWQPHLPEGAVQMWELVEALRQAGWFVHLSVFPGDGNVGAVVTLHSAKTGETVDADVLTPGEAVCLAALQVIGE